MAGADQQASAANRAIWPLLFITAVLQVYFGLSLLAYAVMGVPSAAPTGWIAATAGALQAIAAMAAFMPALRRDLRGTVLALAGSILMGGLSLLPSLTAQGFDIGRDGWGTPAYAVIAPLIAITAATLAWRNRFLRAAAYIIALPTIAGILFVIAFGIMIALYGF